MNQVRVLIEGYARAGQNGEYLASPTTSLIIAGNQKMLVDPGTNKEMLLDALQKANTQISDISFIYLSHYHPDHFMNLRYLPDLDVCDGELRWSNDREKEHGGDLGVPGVEILKTPGHAPEHTSLLVDTEEGKVCIAQDVFWWEDGAQKSDSVEELMNLVDPFASDMEALKKSRKLVLSKADWIIPGHGKKFRNPNKR